MARLRRIYDDAEDSDPVHVPQRRPRRQANQATSQLSRRSLSSNGSDVEASDKENGKVSAKLVLKSQKSSTTKNTARHGESKETSSFRRKSTAVEEETDAEESIWCGSVDGSHSSSGSQISGRSIEWLGRLRFGGDGEEKADKATTIDRPATPPPPPSPPKSKLQSPSKKALRIPTPPLRPSLDAFWTADAINDWNDQYSSQKAVTSPRKLRLQPQPTSDKPTPPQSPTKRSKAELTAIRDFNARKTQVAESFLAELDQTITQRRVQALAASTGGVQIIWSNTLNTTAGRANWRRETTKSRNTSSADVPPSQKHFASIELATKVISTEHRLLNVLAHEFCHLANFMISGVKDQPHGKSFKEWARKVTSAFGQTRGVQVTTKHDYEIEYRYIWRCGEGEGGCGVEFKRHSKSIDVRRQRCGACKGVLVQIKPVPRKVAEAGAPGRGYAGYVKEHFAEVKTKMPGRSHKEVMEALGKKYRAEKEIGKGKVSVEAVAIDLEELKLEGDSNSPVVIDSD